MNRTPLLAAALSTWLALAGCSMQPMKPMQDASLYQRLGGRDAIVAVVDDGVANIAADGRINRRFANANIPHLKSSLVDLICNRAGGPCAYKGRGMADAHEGMNITDAEFSALVEDLVKSLDKFKVPEREKGELLGALGMMKNAIVCH